jgi:hypothetical protein
MSVFFISLYKWTSWLLNVDKLKRELDMLVQKLLINGLLYGFHRKWHNYTNYMKIFIENKTIVTSKLAFSTAL